MKNKINMNIGTRLNHKEIIVKYNGHARFFYSLAEASRDTNICKKTLARLLNGFRGVSSTQGLSVNYSDTELTSSEVCEKPVTKINGDILKELTVVLAPKNGQRWGGPKPDPAGTIEITINELYTDSEPYQTTVSDLAQILNVGIGTVLTQLRADDNIFGVRQVVLNSRITDDFVWYTTTEIEREIHIGDGLAYFMSWNGGDEVVFSRKADMMFKTTLTATQVVNALKDGLEVNGYLMSRRRYYMPWEEKKNHTKAKPKFADLMKLM